MLGTLGIGVAEAGVTFVAPAVAVDVEVTVTSGVGDFEAEAAGFDAVAGTAFVAPDLDLR